MPDKKTEKQQQPYRNDLEAYLTDRRARIEAALADILKKCVRPGRLYEAMAYSLEAGGKRLRPILCMAAAEAVGGDGDKTIPAGCALEFIHTYSLIHDDLPAVDNDDLRRGRPACHLAFDEATAIFAGDALHSLAFFVLSSPDFSHGDAGRQMKIINAIAGATGTDGMIEGQMRDILAQSVALDKEMLEQIHSLKTGAIIRAAVYTGALIGNADERQLDLLVTYAGNIGLAFQAADDILDVTGDPSLMGKAAGSDRRGGKTTYPSLLGLEETRRMAASLVKNSLQALESFDIKAETLRNLAGYMADRAY